MFQEMQRLNNLIDKLIDDIKEVHNRQRRYIPEDIDENYRKKMDEISYLNGSLNFKIKEIKIALKDEKISMTKIKLVREIDGLIKAKNGLDMKLSEFKSTIKEKVE